MATLFAATCTHQATAKSQTKAALLQALQPHHTTAQPYRQWHPTSTEAVWRVAQEVTALCTRLRLMFFGNLHQSWSEFVLADLGLFQYEVVPFDAQSRAFQCRADVDHYLVLHALRQALDDGAERPPCWPPQCKPPAPTLAGTPPRQTADAPGRACEKAADWPLAEQAYAHSQHPGARHRRIRVHERMGRHADALALALQAQAAPKAMKKSQRLARMLPACTALPDYRRAPWRAKTPAKRLHQAPRRSPCPIQAHNFGGMGAAPALAHRRSARVLHRERAHQQPVRAAVLARRVRATAGAFFHPSRVRPADLNAPDFLERRAALFAECLQTLEDGRYRALIRERFASKHGRQSPMCSGGAERAAARAGPALHSRRAPAPVFERLLQAPVAHRSGLPDLVRFWPTRPAEQRYELVEVKGPGDKLQDNQIRWLQYCHAHGLPASVCHVRWLDAPGMEPLMGATAA